MTTRTAKIGELTPDTRNANKGTVRGLALLDKSLRQYGAGRSILVDKHGRVIAGNKTLERYADIGLDDVLVVETDGRQLVAVQRTDLDLETDPKARELAFFDNRSGELDLDWDVEQIAADIEAGVDLAGLWSDGELAELIGDAFKGDGDAEPQIDKAEELRVKWGVESGSLWQLGEHRLICGDCTDPAVVERVMGGEKAGACVTDPPYGVLDNEWDRPFDQRDLDMIFSHTTGLVACFNAAKTETLHAILSLVPRAERVGVWRHSCITPKPGMIWSWQPVFYWRAGNVKAWDSLDWYQGNPERTGEHPTQKPIEFFQKIIACCGDPVIYDPFLGSGTTLIACENLRRKCRAIEISPGYVAVAIQRWVDVTNGTPVQV